MTVSHLAYGKQITSWHARIEAPISKKMSKCEEEKFPFPQNNNTKEGGGGQAMADKLPVGRKMTFDKTCKALGHT